MEEKLWEAYWSDRTIKNRNKLIEHFHYYAREGAGRHFARIPNFVTYGDILSAANLALLQSVERYKKNNKGKASFRTFCNFRISGAIKDYLREVDYLPRVARKFKTKKQAIELLSFSAGEEISEEAIAKQLNMNPTSYEGYNRMSKIELHSLDSMCGFGNENHEEIEIDGLADPRSESQFDNLYFDESLNYHLDLIANENISDRLNGYMRRVFTLRHKHQLMYSEIAERMGISEKYVYLLMRDLLKRIRLAAA